MERHGLRVVRGGAAGTAAEAIMPAPDPVAFREECLKAFEASQVARGFSEQTIGNGAGTLRRFLAACGRPAWEVTREDVDRVVGELAAQGLAASTRRLYVQVFKNFHAFLVARKAAAIEAAFGVRLADPVDEFTAARHVGADSPSASPPPGPERLEDFFGFLRERIASARKYAAAGQDYALFRTLYLARLRADEATMLDRSGVQNWPSCTRGGPPRRGQSRCAPGHTGHYHTTSPDSQTDITPQGHGKVLNWGRDLRCRDGG